MSTGDVLELEVRSDAGALPAVRTRAREWIAGEGWDATGCDEIVLALDEALSNVIRHAYGGRGGQRIIVRLEAIADAKLGTGLEIRVRDFGTQVDPETICGRDLEDVRPGGLGVHIIRAVCDSVEYRPADGGGMLLKMLRFKSHRTCNEDLSRTRRR